MKKIIILVFGVMFFASCSSDYKILIEGVSFVDLNIRATPDYSEDYNIINNFDPGDLVRIVEFDNSHDKSGFSWCKIKLDSIELYQGKEIKYAWVVYKHKDLPFIISESSWSKIEMMYEMEYENGNNEILTGSRTWLTQALYDYVYYDPLRNIKYDFDNKGPEDKGNNPKDEYEVESPLYSVDYTEDDRYPQYCKSRITTSSVNREETSLYAVIFNQSPREIHFFRQDERSNRGSFVKNFDFSSSLNSNIKSLQRKTRKSTVYLKDHYGYKTKLDLSFDAIRIRPQSGRERYIIFNNSGYTKDNMDGTYMSIREEY